jgi:hypothetical protein
MGKVSTASRARARSSRPLPLRDHVVELERDWSHEIGAGQAVGIRIEASSRMASKMIYSDRTGGPASLRQRPAI